MISNQTDKKEIFNCKTPRALFANLVNQNLIIWCGYYGSITQAIDCIAPVKYDIDDDTELASYLAKGNMLCASLRSISFNYNQIPLSAPGNALDVTLGGKYNKITYSLTKRNNGNWFFSEKNFNNPKILKIYNNFVEKTKAPQFISLNSSTKSSAYVNFILGYLGKYDYTLNDALSVLNLKKIPKIVRKEYSEFMAFVLFKVLATKKISLTSITDSYSDTFEILYIKPGVGSVGLTKKVTDPKTGANKWVFGVKTLSTALKIYINDQMMTGPDDPLFFTIQHWLYDNFKLLQNSILGITCIDLILLLLTFYLMFFVYRCLKTIIEFFLNFIGKSIKNCPIYSKRFSVFLALIIATFVGDYLITSIIIFYFSAYVYFVFILTILYTILFIGLLCEILNIISSVVLFILKQKGNKGFRAAFVIDIIRRICSILVVIILIGLLLDKIGVNMVNFLTALGIGGLAVAFAGKDTIENLFGSIMIALEKPFKLGDWIILGEFEGVVEHVGLRSTRIRTFEDSYLTIPNVKFITSSVNNMGERTYRRYTTTLDLEDTTSPGLIKSFTVGISELIMKTPCMRKDGYHIRVNDVGESSVKILVYVFFATLDWGAELKERENFILNILRLAEDLGIKFAFPTQTLLLSKFKGTDNKNFKNMDLEQLNKTTNKAKKTARKIAEKFTKNT